MSNAYLYVFSSETFDRADIGKFLDTLEDEGVENWFYSIPNSVFIVGTMPARELSKRLREHFGEHRHFVTLVSKKAKAGWMPKDHWQLLPKEEVGQKP
jgi:hypothetical protein